MITTMMIRCHSAASTAGTFLILSFLEKDLKVTLQQIGVSHGGLFERQDDVATTAYWYQTHPHVPFAPLMSRKERWPR